jgi:hypothetical protein
MKIEQESVPPSKPAYVPQRVTITLETEEEAKSLCHIFGCWCSQAQCKWSLTARDLAFKLFTSLKLPL